MAKGNGTDNPMKLRTVADLNAASELVFNRQVEGNLDNKTADSMNTTIKHQIQMNYTLPFNMVKLMVQAKIKKIEIPKALEDLMNKE